ncbi:unnamed protein product [Caretta caretta]
MLQRSEYPSALKSRATVLNPFKCFLRDLGSPAAPVPRGVAKALSSPESPPGITPSPPGRRLWNSCVAYLETNSY